jgi:hypothetical protein
LLANGTVTIDGSISVAGTGFRGASTVRANDGRAAEGYGSTTYNNITTTANTSGGGGGIDGGIHGGFGGGGGGGGGHQGSGVGSSGSAGSASSDNAALTIMTFGGGGGGGAEQYNQGNSGAGGNGGGIIFIIAPIITISATGVLNATGNNGTSPTPGISDAGGGGGGAGGSILLKGHAITTTSSVIAYNGAGASHTGSGSDGGAGSTGRITIYYSTSTNQASSPSSTNTFDSQLADPRPNYVKADIKATTTQGSSVAVNILKTTSQANSAKANLIKYRGILDNSVIANFARTHYEKKYDYRVYDPSGSSYITTWSKEVITLPEFRAVHAAK